jgi:hypothetical protein
MIPKAGAAEDKLPWGGNCSSVDRAAGGDEGLCFHLVLGFSGDERLICRVTVQGVFRHPITPRILN